MLRVHERDVLALLTSIPDLAWVGAGRYGWGDVGDPQQPTFVGSAGLRLFEGAWGLVSFNYDMDTRYAGNVILDNWSSTSFSDTYVWVTHDALLTTLLVEPSNLREYGGFAPNGRLLDLRYGNGTTISSTSRRTVVMDPPTLGREFLCATAYSQYPALSSSYGTLNGYAVPYASNTGTATSCALGATTMRIGSSNFSSGTEPLARTFQSAMFAGARYTGPLPKDTCHFLSSELSRMFNRRRDFIFVPALFVGGGYTHPTLSAATLVPAGGNTYEPRVTYTF